MTEPLTMNAVITLLSANGGALILILGQLFRMERRLGKGDSTLERLQKHCPMFNGNKCPNDKTLESLNH